MHTPFAFVFCFLAYGPSPIWVLPDFVFNGGGNVVVDIIDVVICVALGYHGNWHVAMVDGGSFTSSTTAREEARRLKPVVADLAPYRIGDGVLGGFTRQFFFLSGCP